MSSTVLTADVSAGVGAGHRHRGGAGGRAVATSEHGARPVRGHAGSEAGDRGALVARVVAERRRR